MSQSVKQPGEARTEIGKYARGNRYRAEYISGTGYVVIGPDGSFVPNSQTPFRQQAERQRDELQCAEDRAKKRGARPCMCCGKVFTSDGIHNRLCDPCRGRGLAMADDVRPQLPRANGRS